MGSILDSITLPSQASDLCTKLIGLTIEKTVTFHNITLFECKVAKINYQERSTPTKCFGFGQIGSMNLRKCCFTYCWDAKCHVCCRSSSLSTSATRLSSAAKQSIN